METQQEFNQRIKKHMESLINSINSKFDYEETSGDRESEWVQGYDQGVLEANQFYLNMLNEFIAQHEPQA